MSSRCHVFLSSVEKKLSFLRKTFQDFSPYNGLQWQVQISVSMQLQRALHNPSRGIRVLSSKMIGHFLKNIKQYILLTTNACLALVWPYAVCSHVGKVTRDIGGSTNPVFTKRMCKDPLQKGKATMLDDFWSWMENEMDVFALTFLTELHKRRANQCDYVIHEVAHAHCRAQALWLKKYRMFIFNFYKWQMFR